MRRRKLVAVVACVAALVTFGREGSAATLPQLDIPDFPNRPGPQLYEFFNLVMGTSLGANSELPAPLVQETFALGGSAGAVLLGSDLGMANENDFGFYTDLGVGSSLSQVFADVGPLGIGGPPYEAAFFETGGEVGLYLQASGLNDDLWHSESMLDAGSTAFAHMVAFALPSSVQLETSLGLVEISNGYLIGWEDLDDGSEFLDGDYNDQVLLVGSLEVLSQVPEPATAHLVLAGLGAAALIARRRRA